jgi:hypothetical protein
VKWITIAFALAASAAGAKASWEWLQASKLKITPVEQSDLLGKDLELSSVTHISITFNMIAEMQAGTRRNRIAAQWTAVTVALGALASLLSLAAN